MKWCLLRDRASLHHEAMQSEQPGEAIIDFYMPAASAGEREAALGNLHGAMEVVFRIVARNAAIPTDDSTHFEAAGRILSLTDPP